MKNIPYFNKCLQETYIPYCSTAGCGKTCLRCTFLAVRDKKCLQEIRRWISGSERDDSANFRVCRSRAALCEHHFQNKEFGMILLYVLSCQTQLIKPLLRVIIKCSRKRHKHIINIISSAHSLLNANLSTKNTQWQSIVPLFQTQLIWCPNLMVKVCLICFWSWLLITRHHLYRRFRKAALIHCTKRCLHVSDQPYKPSWNVMSTKKR